MNTNVRPAASVSSSLGASPGKALITGASRGIGAVYADRLARRGHDLILVARDAHRLQSLAEHLRQETGRKVELLVADLAEAAGLQRVTERLREDASIELLVNNAGLGATAPLLGADIDQIDAMIFLNVVALTRLTHAAVPGFASRGRGTVINIASVAALAPELLNGSYSGSKAYVLNFSQSMHHELWAKGVRVQAVLPGATGTDFWGLAGLPLEHLPKDIVMSAEDMVDAALAGLDAGELVTIPSLPDAADWQRFEQARQALGANLSKSSPAPRYFGG